MSRTAKLEQNMPLDMGRSSTAELQSRGSARPRRQRSSAADTITVKQKMSAITIHDSSDPVAPPNFDAGDHMVSASNRPWGRAGKAPLQSHGTSQPLQGTSRTLSGTDDGSEISEYSFTEEDYYMGTDDDDQFSDNQSVISVESSDDDRSEYPLSDRPWAEFPPSMRKQWEMMYCMVCVRQLHGDWDMTELYQHNKDDEMLRYMEDFPLPQWLIPQDDAQQAYQRLMERSRWRNLGISIYGHQPNGRGTPGQQSFTAPANRLPREPPRPAPSQRHSQERPRSQDVPQEAVQQQSLHSQSAPRPSVALQMPPQQNIPQQNAPQQATTQQSPAPPGATQQNAPQQNTPQQNAPQQGAPQQGTPLQNVPQQNNPAQQNAPQNIPQAAPANMAPPPPNQQGMPLSGTQYPAMQPNMQGMPQPQPMYYGPQPGMQWAPPYAQPPPQQAHPMQQPYPYPPNTYGHPGMGYPAAPTYYPTYQQQPASSYKYAEPPKRRNRKDTPPPQSPPPPPQTPPYAARKRPIEKKPGNKPGRKSNRKHAEAEEFPWTRKLDFKEEKQNAKWDLSVYPPETLVSMEATRQRNIAVIEDIDAKIQEQQRIARAAKKMKDKAGNPSEVDGKKVRQKREGRPKGDVGGDPYHSGVFAFATPADEEIAAHLGFASPDEVIDNAEVGKVEPDVQASIKIYWDPGKKGMTENLEQAKFSVRDTVVTRKQLENTPILTKVAAECIVDFCPDLLWRTMLLRITSEAGCGNKDVRDRFCHNGCYCDKATITKRISAALGQKQTQPKSKGYQPGEWEWYDENVKDFSKYIDYFGMRTSHRNMLKIQMAGEKRKRDTHTEESGGDPKANEDQDKRQKLAELAPAPPKEESGTEANGNHDIEAGNESAEDSDDSNAVSLQDSDVLDKMED